MPVTDKPPYRVPFMDEINALPWNGYNVVSTFSGCGGSCLGYRMAGFKVLWANEFVPAAQDSYRANAPESLLDCRDIKTVQPQEILNAIGLQKGDIDILDGSPPCQAFSTAGKREKGWGENKTYENGISQKNEDLFYEYIRLLRGLMPKVFVAENVSGLVKGTAKGYFLDILKQMKESGYRVTCRVLDAQWLGVPQARQRTIFVGVRDDLGLDPVHPKPMAYRYSVRDALPWIKNVHQPNVYGEGDRNDSGPCPSVKASGSHVGGSYRYTVESETDLTRYAVGAERDNRGKFGNGGNITDTPAPTVLADSVGPHWINTQAIEMETDISKYAIGEEWDKTKEGNASDKYFSLVKPDREKPCPTITAKDPTGGSAQVCHPTEKRKFTIAELRRICGFPDDFILIGTYAQQWERLGNSVPAVMMSHIASTIRDGILKKISVP